ncbi:MAG: T9SS type A sorting domain-containing protein [Saprospiraceae bacterium]|nr:T9SS type A sorting domain-containing protein [Saprospiraceae bacterium]
MNAFYRSRLFPITGLLLGMIVWLASNANPQNANTGAPFDGHCNNCHGGNNPGGFGGTVEISGLPSTIEPNTLYPMTITLTPTAGSPVKGGFQLVVVNGSNGNAGDLAAVNAQAGTEFAGGREYIDHRNGKTFVGGGPVSWNFNWTSPAVAAGNTIKVYFIGNFTNNNNNDTGDWPIAAVETFAFNGLPPLSAAIADKTNVSCFGGNNGSATVEASGGATPYTYLWSNGQTGQTAINLVAGTYNVTVTGANGSGTATASVTITQPTAMTASATPGGTLTCSVPTINVTANAGGGTPPYSYSWANGATGNPAPYSTPGTSSVIVTDNNGCTKTATFTVNSNTIAPNAVAGPPGTLTCTQSQINLNGAGSSSGPIYSYIWTASNGGNIVSGATTLNPLVNAAGTYTIQVSNSVNGCTSTASTTVTSNINPPNASAAGGTITCLVPTVTLMGSSITPGVTYAWTGPGGFNSPLQNPTVSVAGLYTLTVTNPANACTNTATATVIQGAIQPAVTASAAGQLTCAVNSIQLTANSNPAGTTYAWTGPGGFTSSLQNPTVNAPGIYNVVVTAANGCTGSDTSVVNQNITAPGATASANGEITCINPGVQLNGGSPGGPNVTYAWAGPNNYSSTQQNPTVNAAGTYTLTVTAAINGCTSTATATVIQNTAPPVASIAVPGNLNCNNATIQINAAASSQGPNFAYLWTTANGNIVSGATTLTPVVNAAGTYTLSITNNASGCTATAGTTVSQTPAVTASATATNVSCNGGSNGSATVTPGGGAGNFTFLWSNNATTATITGLPAGTYTVITTDGENCTASASVTVMQPAVLASNASATGESALGANDGTATAAPTGGTSPYTYLWSNNATTATITGLTPGNYTVSVTDANNCTSVQTVTVNSFNCALSASISSTNVTCNGANNGTATVNLVGAVAPVQYLWSNNAITPSISGLAAGTYTVSILDANNCPASLSVSISQPAVLAANATATAETASGANDGTATALPTGGTSPYTYLWSNNATTATITGLTPGSYSVSVTDANNCTTNQTVFVSAFNCFLTADVNSVNVVCLNDTNGQATAIVQDGELPFIYQWSNQETTATISNLGIGTYSVIVIDANGCIASDSIKIIASDSIPPTISCPGNISFCGADVVAYSAPVVSDNCNLNGAQPVLISGLPSGSPFNDGVTTQVFKVTDAVGNTAQCSFTVTVFALPDVLVNGSVNDTNNLGTGSIFITPVGGVPPYSFIWRKNGEFFSNEEDLTGLNAGNYSLTLIDANGCSVMLAPVMIGNTVGTNEPGAAAYIRLWPNPAQTAFRVEMNGLQVNSAQIFTPQGRLVQEINPEELTGEISVEQLPEGIYFLRATSREGVQAMIKWVKAN